MKIIAFYQQAGIDCTPEIRLVTQWCNAWKAIGWDPVVLNESHAVDHPLYDAMVKQSIALPSVADKTYQRFCFVRWLALANYGGGFFTDYDVFPVKPFTHPEITHSLNGCLELNPGFIHGSKSWVEMLCKTFLKYEPRPTDVFNGMPNVNDMDVIQNSRHLFNEVLDLCRLVNDPGWRTVPLVHFANNNFRHRYQGVSALLDIPYL